MSVIVLLAALVLSTSSGSSPGVQRGVRAQAAGPPIGHVFTIVLENKNYEKTFGPDTQAPYLASELAAKGALLPNYYGTGHASLDNYVTMVSGQAPNPVTQADCGVFADFTPGVTGPDGQAVGTGCVYPAGVKTVADQLTAAQRTWRGYMQDMGADPAREAATCGHPAIGAQDKTQRATAADQYATRHDPFVYFHSIIDDQASCDAHVVGLGALDADLASPARTPDYAFITPDLCSDGHDATCADSRQKGGYEGIDDFLKATVPKILNAPAFKRDGLLIITFDEAEDDSSACCDEPPGANTPRPGIQGPGGGRVGAVLLGPGVVPGTVVETPINHYGYLRSVEDAFGLEHLGYAGRAGLATFQSIGAVIAAPAAARVSRPVRYFKVPRRIKGPRLIVRVRLAAGVVGHLSVKRGRMSVARATVRGTNRKTFEFGVRPGRYRVTLRATRGGATVARRTRVARRARP